MSQAIVQPLVKVTSRCTSKTLHLYSSAVTFYLTQLLPRSRTVTQVDIIMVPPENPRLKHAHGWCQPADSDSRTHFQISMARRRPLIARLQILAHECVHVAQFACGQLAIATDEDGDLCLQWAGRHYPPMLHLEAAGMYDQTPWEVDADARTAALTNAFVDHAIADGMLSES